ncbi:MAG: serine/threonine protein kinase, partial [Ignavibacteriales bacterium]
HHNLIKVLDFGTAGSSFYISFEYFESRNLRKVITKNNLSEDDKINLCIQLFKALDAAHQRGIIHRDIKPENILVNSKLELKIADFGLASIRDENILTHKSSIVGTPGYMSPEQIRGEDLTPQTDLFSSGIVIYELFTGENPLIGKDISATINNILNFKIEKDFKQISSLPDEIQNVLKELLRKNFSKRTKTALDALNFFKLKEKPLEENVSLPVLKNVRKSKIYWIAFTVILLITAAIVVMNLMPEDNTLQPKQNIPLITEEKDSLPDMLTESAPVKKDVNIINEDETEDPVEDENNSLVVIPSDGKLFVEVSPWADVFLNGEKAGTTPLNREIELEAGNYHLKLSHPDFPDYSDSIQIVSGELQTVKINFYEEVGYLDCKIFPWGEIYIDGTYKNSTPLREPMILMPGEYIVKITNPGFKDEFEETITIKAKENVTLKYNFDESR